jgi:hypothetical protein
MTDWAIQIPFADRDEPLLAVADHARSLETDEARTTVRQLVLDGVRDGMATAGDLLDQLSDASPAERRTMLDDARARAGLPLTAEVDRARARAAHVPMIGGLQRDEGGCAIQACPDCGAFSRNPATNEPMPVAARKWWCPEHEAGHEDDMQPWTARIAFGPSGAIVFLDEQEREAEVAEREAKRRAAELEQRHAQRLAQWPALEAERQADTRMWTGANLKTAARP